MSNEADVRLSEKMELQTCDVEVQGERLRLAGEKLSGKFSNKSLSLIENVVKGYGDLVLSNADLIWVESLREADVSSTIILMVWGKILSARAEMEEYVPALDNPTET